MPGASRERATRASRAGWMPGSVREEIAEHRSPRKPWARHCGAVAPYSDDYPHWAWRGPSAQPGRDRSEGGRMTETPAAVALPPGVLGYTVACCSAKASLTHSSLMDLETAETRRLSGAVRRCWGDVMSSARSGRWPRDGSSAAAAAHKRDAHRTSLGSRRAPVTVRLVAVAPVGRSAVESGARYGVSWSSAAVRGDGDPGRHRHVRGRSGRRGDAPESTSQRPRFPRPCPCRARLRAREVGARDELLHALTANAAEARADLGGTHQMVHNGNHSHHATCRLTMGQEPGKASHTPRAF